MDTPSSLSQSLDDSDSRMRGVKVCMVVVFVIHHVRLMDFVTLAQKLVNVRQVGLV